MEAIKLWLNGRRDYKTGARLYSLYGNDLQKKRMFAEAETPFKLQSLIRELEALAQTTRPTPPPTVSPKDPERLPAIPPAPRKEYVWSEHPDQVERSIHLRWKPLFVELMDLVSRVGDMAREARDKPAMKPAVAQMALRILDLDDQLELIYQERDHYIKTGSQLNRFPFGEPCVDPRLIPTKLANHKRYVREFRLKLKEDPENTSAAKNLQKHEWFVDYYSSQIPS